MKLKVALEISNNLTLLKQFRSSAITEHNSVRHLRMQILTIVQNTRENQEVLAVRTKSCVGMHTSKMKQGEPLLTRKET